MTHQPIDQESTKEEREVVVALTLREADALMWELGEGGGLTTPGCDENTWRKFMDAIRRSREAKSALVEPGLQRFRYEADQLVYEPRDSAPEDWDGDLGDLIGDYYRAEDADAKLAEVEHRAAYNLRGWQESYRSARYWRERAAKEEQS